LVKSTSLYLHTLTLQARARSAERPPLLVARSTEGTPQGKKKTRTYKPAPGANDTVFIPQKIGSLSEQQQAQLLLTTILELSACIFVSVFEMLDPHGKGLSGIRQIFFGEAVSLNNRVCAGSKKLLLSMVSRLGVFF